MAIIKVVSLGNDTAPDVKNNKANNNKGVDNAAIFGSDNLYPQFLNRLSKKSPTHGAILQDCHTFTMGEGFLEDDLTPNVLSYISKVNKTESLYDVYSKLASDYDKYGNAYIEVQKKGSMYALFHVDAATVRAKKMRKEERQVQMWLTSSDWADTQFKVNEFPAFDGKEKISIIQIKNYFSENQYYGLPRYIHGIPNIELESLIPDFNISQFRNGFMPSGTMIIRGEAKDQEEANKYIDNFKEKLTGETNGNKIVFIFEGMGGENVQGTEWIPIDNEHDGDFLNLDKRVSEKIVVSHRWRNQLLGIETAGKLGGSKEYREAFEGVYNTVIKGNQRPILRTLNDLLDRQGLDGNLSIARSKPVGFSTDIDVHKIITVNEARKALGMAELEEGTNPIENGTNNDRQD
jgi:hypothetical protein